MKKGSVGKKNSFARVDIRKVNLKGKDVSSNEVREGLVEVFNIMKGCYTVMNLNPTMRYPVFQRHIGKRANLVILNGCQTN
jgi:hypothetical protein